MEELKIEVPEESEQESSFSKVFLRFVAAIICGIFGLALILFGYLFAIFLDLNLEVFNASTTTCFLISILMWVLIGLFTPLALFQRFFEEIRDITIGRVIVSIIAFVVILFLHWYIVNIVTEMIV